MRISTTLEILRAGEASQDTTTIPGIKNLRTNTVERVLRAAGWPDLDAVTETRRRLQYDYAQGTTPIAGRELNEENIAAAVAGERAYLRPVERREAVRRLVAQGVDDEGICARLRVCQRTVRRMKAAA